MYLCCPLVAKSEDHPHIQAALKVITAAENLEDNENFEGALEKYELALGALIKILQGK